MSLEDVMMMTDWTLLREQKLSLVNASMDGTNPSMASIPMRVLDGLIHFLDNIQDAVVHDGLVADETVFGKEETK